MTMFRLYFMLPLIIWFGLNGQDYLWPTEASRDLSSNFGEFRDSHFHMGLDIKTNGVENYPVIAIDNGYISRMITNFNGFGKALYLTTRSGNIAVYAHLNRFSPPLETALRVHQHNIKSYFVDKYFNPLEYPVKKGEIIGYTGSTGASFGPHLHFELRDFDNIPLNPLVYGLRLPDRIAPTFDRLAIIPLAGSTTITGRLLPAEFEFIRTRSNDFYLADTIHIDGEVGLALKCFDRREGAKNTYQVHDIQLFIDDHLQYRARYDSISYVATKRVNTVNNNYFSRTLDESFQSLYKSTGEPPLAIESLSGEGRINLSPGSHKLKIIILDPGGNASTATAHLVSGPGSKAELTTLERNNSYTVFSLTPTSGNLPLLPYKIRLYNLHGYPEEEISPENLELDGKTVRFSLPSKNLVNRTVQVLSKNRLGIHAVPAHWGREIYGTSVLDIQRPALEKIEVENNLYLQIRFDSFISVQPELSLGGNSGSRSLGLRQVEPQTYLSTALKPQEIGAVRRITLLIGETGGIGQQKIFHYEWKPEIAIPGESISLASADGNCFVGIGPNSLYAPALLWIDELGRTIKVTDGIQIGDVYQIQPFTRTLKDTIQIRLTYSEKFEDETHLGIFTFDKRKQRWLYQSSAHSPAQRSLTTTLKSCEIVTIIQDNTPPVIAETFPASGGYYHFQDVEILRSSVRDALSGIESSEASVQLDLDGKRLFAEFQPIKGEISYRLDSPLNSGSHVMRVAVRDKVGNRTLKEIKFTVN